MQRLITGKLLFCVVKQYSNEAMVWVRNLTETEPDWLASISTTQLKFLTGHVARTDFMGLMFTAEVIQDRTRGPSPYSTTYQVAADPLSDPAVSFLRTLATLVEPLAKQPELSPGLLFSTLPTDLDLLLDSDGTQWWSYDNEQLLVTGVEQLELLHLARRGRANHCVINVQIGNVDCNYDAVYVGEIGSAFSNLHKLGDVQEVARYGKHDTEAQLVRLQSRIQSLQLRSSEHPLFRGNIADVKNGFVLVSLRSSETGEAFSEWIPEDRFNFPQYELTRGSIVECVRDRHDFELIRNPAKQRSSLKDRLAVALSNLDLGRPFGEQSTREVPKLHIIRLQGPTLH